MNIRYHKEKHASNESDVPHRVQSVLTRTPQDDIITPGTSTVAKLVAVTFLEISHVSECQLNPALSKRLQYVLDYFPTQTRFA